MPLDDLKRIDDILQANRSKNFVQRILQPANYPVLELPGGDHATHMMAWGEVTDDSGKPKYVVFPTVQQVGDRLVNYGKHGFKQAMKTKEYIEFDSPEDADWFSRNYKAIWQGAK